MKKLAAVLLAISLAIPAVYAQTVTDTSTGNYSGTVDGLCLIRSDLNPSATIAPTNTVNPGDGFNDTFTYSDNFSFQSNTQCFAKYTPNQASDQEQLVNNVGGDVLTCTGYELLELAQGQTPVSAPVTFTATDGDGILVADTYKYTCTVEIGPAS